MLKSNKSLMILLFCLVMFNVIYRNIQATDEGDVLGLVNMFMMISLAVTGGFYSIRRDDSKKYGKYGIQYNINRKKLYKIYISWNKNAE